MQAAIIDSVVEEVMQAAIQVSSVANEDFKAKEHNAAIPLAQV